MTNNNLYIDHGFHVKTRRIESERLKRSVKVDTYLPKGKDFRYRAYLLINDGQDLKRMNLLNILTGLYAENLIQPMVIVGIHAGNRIREYGTSGQLDYMNRGDLADDYNKFIIEELLPLVRQYAVDRSYDKLGICGFSLGGLSALDIGWKHPQLFSIVGVFSGSLWWRRKAFNPRWPDSHRIIHETIKRQKARPGMKFWFQCGTEDETEDRNGNGIIDAIDDTLAMIDILKGKGYNMPEDMYYHEIQGGKHDVATWGQSMPLFLKWAFKP